MARKPRTSDQPAGHGKARAGGGDHPLDGPQPTDSGKHPLEGPHPTDGEGHVPVMLQEAMEALGPHDGAVFVDATFGGGGYSEALLEAANCTVWGLDRDPQALARGAELERRYPGRLRVLSGRFSEMDSLLAAHGVTVVNGIAFDLGVSSYQLDQPERGFSFRADGPLDMRMGGPEGLSAADVVNGTDEAALADILYRYGDERKSRRIARAIVRARATKPITRTLELAAVIRSAMGGRGGRGGGKSGKAGKRREIDPATRSFQALRIFVNDELSELDKGLMAAERLLADGGRLVVVSFHSLEDRRVKEFIRTRSGHGLRASRHSPLVALDPLPGAGHASSFEPLYKRVLRPGQVEQRSNPRARSARLRAAVRTAAPPWDLENAA